VNGQCSSAAATAISGGKCASWPLLFGGRQPPRALTTSSCPAGQSCIDGKFSRAPRTAVRRGRQVQRRSLPARRVNAPPVNAKCNARAITRLNESLLTTEATTAIEVATPSAVKKTNHRFR